MTRRIEIKSGLFGKRTVSYDCPSCAARLTSPERDVGASDSCPDCNAVFRVPGREEFDRLNHAQELAELEKQRAAEQQKIEKAQAQQEGQRREVELEKQRLSRERNYSNPVAAGSMQLSPPTKRCPYCAEEILADAKKCRHCGEYLTAELRKANAPALAAKGGGGCGPVLTIAFGIIVAVIILALL